MMKFEEFCKHCQVWHLGHFWHVHANSHIGLSGWDPAWDHILSISSTNVLPIRWTNSSNTGIIWTHNNKISSPYEAAMIRVEPIAQSLYTGYDPSIAPVMITVDTKNGGYAVRWDIEHNIDGLRLIQTQPDAAPSTVMLWSKDAAKIKGNFFEIGRDEILASFGAREKVRYSPGLLTSWAWGGKRNKYNVKDRGGKFHKCSDITVYEQGMISPTGELSLTRIIGCRTLSWLDDTRDRFTLHRDDGPAIVELHNIKERITDKRVDRFHFGSYKHKWYIRGNVISQVSVENWAKHNGAVIRHGQLGYSSAFPNEIDKMAWIASHI